MDFNCHRDVHEVGGSHTLEEGHGTSSGKFYQGAHHLPFWDPERSFFPTMEPPSSIGTSKV